MSRFNSFKLSSIPAQWVPDAVYYVRNGVVVDCYVTDDFGNPFQLGISPSSPGGALIIGNRLSEFSDATSKLQARINLDLEVIDCGVY